MTKLQLIIVYFVLCSNTYAQTALNTDSLKKMIYQLPDDTAKVNRLNNFIAKIQFTTDPFEAVGMMEYSISIADKINYPLGASTAYGMRAMMLFYEMKLDTARLLVDKAYALISNHHDIPSRNQLAALTNIYGSIQQQKQNYDSALEKYQDAARIYTETKNELKVIFSFYNLSVMHGFLQEPSKSLFYAKEVQRIAGKARDSIFILRSLIALSDAHLNMKNYDSALLFVRSGLAMALKQNMTFAIGKFNAILGTYFSEGRNQADSAVVHYNTALKHYRMINL